MRRSSVGRREKSAGNFQSSWEDLPSEALAIRCPVGEEMNGLTVLAMLTCVALGLDFALRCVLG
jgi:hypothetical protein